MRDNQKSEVGSRKPENRGLKTYLILFFVVLGDQLSKFLVKRQIFFKSQIVENPGLPFGINLPGFFDLFVIIFLLPMFIILYEKYWGPKRSGVGFALIVGGALANILDRLPDGKVIDFINLSLTTLNLADLAIMGGIALIALSAIRIPNS